MKHSFCYSLLSNFRFRRCGASTIMITICAGDLRVSFFRMSCCEITRTSFSTGSTPSCPSSSRTSRPTKSCESCGILTVTQSVMQFVSAQAVGRFCCCCSGWRVYLCIHILVIYVTESSVSQNDYVNPVAVEHHLIRYSRFIATN